MDQDTTCLPVETRRPEDTVSTPAEKSLAFEAVITSDGVYGDYRFVLDTSSTPSGAIVPVLSQSIAGLESSWSQYTETNETILGVNTDGTCDYGMMQVNSGQAYLFNKTPSLRSDTQGNIAAGTEILAQKWNEGVPGGGDLPVVNDMDPERLLNWYYALSAYNGGPAGNVWVNNPNCGQDNFRGECLGSNFAPSRSDGAEWLQLPVSNFPYQERVWYNLEYPRFPENETAQWIVGRTGLLTTTGAITTGLRPDDALFRTEEQTSRAPNLLLFQHYSPRANIALPQQQLTFAFDLPRRANVTIEILDAQQNEIVGGTVVAAESFPAGWTHVTRPIPFSVERDYSYRIRAEIGDPSDVTTWYIGQYVQPLRLFFDPISLFRLYLPFTVKGTTPSRSSTGILRNGDFAIRSPLPGQSQQPAYWDIQTIINTEDGTYAGSLNDYTFLCDEQLCFKVAPRAREEIRQRPRFVGTGDYVLSFDATVSDKPSGSETALIVRIRPIQDGATSWTTLLTLEHHEEGHYRTEILDMHHPFILSFLVLADDTDAETRFTLDNVRMHYSHPDLHSTE
jgi:hypothetical protein